MWQPIETAPRDGTAIWLLVDNQPYIGYCQPADRLWQTKESWFIKATFRRRRQPDLPDEICGCYGHGVHPTQWMPLPAPLTTFEN